MLLEHSDIGEIRDYIANDIRAELRTDSLSRGMRTNLFVGAFYACRRVQLEQNINTTLARINRLRRSQGMEDIGVEELKVDGVEGSDGTILKLTEEFRSYSDELNKLNLEIDDYCRSKDAYEAFIKQSLEVEGGWLSYTIGATGMLDALAHIMKVRVYVWVRQSPGSNQLALNHRTKQKGLKKRINLLHTNRLTHFNLLEIIPDEGASDEAVGSDIEPDIEYSPHESDDVNGVILDSTVDGMNHTSRTHDDSEEGTSSITPALLRSSFLYKSL